ncbi:non-ribosomal peptide synthetase [Xanthomonas sp. GW]|uniref:non-ribosomal peptide synthetase n=1 Tax=Xanthomonas sp. GW TaxID=2724121 RepID=UPI00185F4278|nr:non-ribosomal peptide synthetase [Xanthomonas sp. GW]QNH20775.1 non-ribosomal peptide synthetase [Xanthomonas sp. GW]
MSLLNILRECQRKGIRLAIKNDKLLVSATKGELTPELRARLSEFKPEILDWLTTKSLSITAITRKSVRDLPLPLSLAQHRLWFLDRLDASASAAYHIPAALRLSGALNREALQATLDRLVARHESLRTHFVVTENEPCQVVAAEDCGFTLTEQDLRSLEGEAQQREVERLAREEAGAAFDLTSGPLIRGRLLQLAAEEHVLLITQHHIITDGWSLGVMVREVGALYTAFSQGQADPLPALEIQYADYAAWQRSWLQGEELERQLGFWREHLVGAPGLLELPSDRPRPAVQSYAGGSVPFELTPELTAQLRGLAQRHGCTLFMVLLAGWSVLLSRLSGQEDVVIGTPVANRQRREVEGLIGFFVNTLALRVRMEEAPSVAELLAQVKATALAAFAHQELPFEQVVEALRPARSLGHGPVFQTMLALNNTPDGGALELPGLTLAPQDSAIPTTQVDLSLHLADGGNVFSGMLVYASDLFDRGTIERWAVHLQQLLSALVAEEQRSVATLPLLTQGERAQLLEGFNATAAEYPRATLIHELFEAQAAQQPEAVAVVYEDQRLTYGELNARANQVAHRLIALGVKPDDRVAICVERSLEMVVGLLGILKAGGAYVPLDPTYPAERLAYMLEDSAPVAVLTQADAAAQLAALEVPVLELDAAETCGLLAEQPTGNPDARAGGLTSGHLAYVIYTSGSTGMPKGVMVEHVSAMNLIAAHAVQCGLVSTDRVFQFSSFAFDASVEEIFPALSTGSTIIVRSTEFSLSNESFSEYINRYGITVVELPTAIWHQWALTLSNAVYRSLRLVVVGGEKAERRVIRVWRDAGGMRSCCWLNTYGPTESTVYSVAISFDETVDLPLGEIPIGRPIANTQIYILDRHGEPVPLGVSGEIHIGGAGVARGYLNRPELTAERFLKDPFSPAPEARMYKTGDLGRWLPDGTIEFLGRNDHQVKIRGFRIELGEIEARLTACAGVREAVVVAREDEAGDKRLVAYLLAEADTALSAIELRADLSSRLPDYMVPGAFVQLEAFPLTPNGKLDRRALPAPDEASVASREYEAPQGEIEEALAGIWQELLGVERVGRRDNFFELGGHSLLAVRLMAHVRSVLGVEVALRELFAHPTLQTLANVVQEAQHSTLGAITSADRTEPLPLSLAQHRLWFLDRLDASASAAYHIPAALRLSGALNREALQATLDRLVARHESLRTHFVVTENEPCQVVAAEDCGFTLTEQDLRSLEGEAQQREVERLAREEAGAAFDLTSGPLIRGRLLQLAAEEHVLLITQHHIITDGWSLGVMVREVGALYTAFSQGQADPLPALEIQYADYAAWQRSWLQGEELERQLGFWREHLVGAPGLLELPSDRPRPAVQSYAGGSVPFELTPELTAQLRGLAQRHGCTLFMVLLAGWSVLLSRLSGQEDVVIGTPVANRQRREVEGLIGFFVNTLALRVRMEEAPSVAELLAQVKATALAAFAHQELPFEQVVEALRPARSLGHGPVFQTMLALNNTPDGGALELPGLTLAPQDSAIPTTQVDLSLHLADGGNVFSGMLVYASDLFDRGTIERWAVHLQQLLSALVAEEQRSVATLPLLTQGERAQLLEGFNATAAEYPRATLIHELFEAQAAQQPEAVAVVYEDQRLTYGELNARANQVAHRLIALGVKPDDRVAICVERSLEMVVGLLGILKAGGAYVPLDPTYPAERLAYMLEDSAPVAVLTQADAAAQLAALEVPVLELDAAETCGLLAEQPTGNPDARAGGLTSGHLAYVIYTSGSTGMPKGVMVEHVSAMNLIAAHAVQCGLVSTDRVFQFSSFAFDASVEEIFPALSTGSTIIVRSTEFSLSNESFSEYINRYGITVVELPTAIWHQWALTLSNAVYRSLRLVVVGGEKAERRVIRVWRDAGGMRSCCWLNTYGPTESTVYSVAISFDETVDLPLGEIPIGRPIANTQIYILDRHGEPVPLGVSGEIHIGGAGVARGYLNRPELTAERFLKDPFSPAPEARMYKTGDLGRWLPDGTIEFLGRNDHQVKIRGFRIELGEIEARLTACAGVREAVVVAREDEAGDKRLVAYLLAEADTALSAIELRADLSSRLPDYMVPGAFVQLEAFPLTPNGKLDRRALPAPDEASVASREYEAPQGEIEEALAGIWQELLGVERVGRRDNFFELGGHSLLAVQVIKRLQGHFHVVVSLQSIFNTPQLAAFAEKIDAAQREQISSADLSVIQAQLNVMSDEELLAFLEEDNS